MYCFDEIKMAPICVPKSDSFGGYMISKEYVRTDEPS